MEKDTHASRTFLKRHTNQLNHKKNTIKETVIEYLKTKKNKHMATYTQEKAFIGAIISSDLLDNAIDWIKSNMSPDDVFDQKVLESWAEENKYVKETD